MFCHIIIIIRLHAFILRVLLAVKEHQPRVRLLQSSQLGDSVYHFMGHGHTNGMYSIDDAASIQTEEDKTTLCIAHRPQRHAPTVRGAIELSCSSCV